MALKTQGSELYYMPTATTVTKIGQITGITGLGGAAAEIDVSNLDSTDTEVLPGLKQSSAISVPLNFDPAVPAHLALLALYNSGATVKFAVGLADGTAAPTAAGGNFTFPSTRSYRSFSGQVVDFPTDFALNSKVEGQVSVRRTGPITDSWKP